MSKKTKSKSSRKPRQAVMEIDGETIDLSIPEIDACADAHLRARKREADGKLVLREKTIKAYDELDRVMYANMNKLPTNAIYTYTAYDNKRKQVALGKRKITIRNAKAVRVKNVVERTKATEAINPDQGGALPSLE